MILKKKLAFLLVHIDSQVTQVARLKGMDGRWRF